MTSEILGKHLTDSTLLFRRQFLLTPDPCASLSHWQHIRVGHFHLYAHPDIQLSAVTSADRGATVALVGYIINPHNPDWSNVDILNAIAMLGDSVDMISDYLRSVSGRFVLILDFYQRETLLFHDACGLRTVYYMQYKDSILVGSQPSIIEQVVPLKRGERFFSYAESSYVRDSLEHWMPSGCSLFEEVHHLVPNHYLRFSDLKQIRYWPIRILSRRQVHEVVAQAAVLLEKIIIAAHNRFKLALPLTAGWDSRILLGASKSIADKIYFFTLQYRDLNFKSNDIKIPRKLLQSLGLHHNLIDCRKVVPSSFREIYERNSVPAHMIDWGEIAYGMYDAYPHDRISLKGNCSEIARCYYYKCGTHKPVSSPDQIIARVRGWHALKFARDQISTWFNEAAKVAAEARLDILDLFYWEHRMGSWQAQSQLEWDIVLETYTPFNHRELLELMLVTPSRLRSEPRYTLYKMMLQILWPETMRLPMNPAPLLTRKWLRYVVTKIAARRTFD